MPPPLMILLLLLRRADEGKILLSGAVPRMTLDGSLLLRAVPGMMPDDDLSLQVLPGMMPDDGRRHKMGTGRVMRPTMSLSIVLLE